MTVTCKNCEMKVPMESTHFDRTGANLLCKSCYNQLQQKENILQTVDSGRSKYACTYCGYKFSRDADTSVDNCPYCGKPTTVIERKGNTKLNEF